MNGRRLGHLPVGRLISLVVVLTMSTFSSAQTLPPSIFNDTPPDLNSLPTNSLFTYWRPKAHFIAPNSWQNDPMNMWVESSGNGTLTWHVGYQYSFGHVQSVNISQATAFSHDLITWTDDVGPHQFDPTNLTPTTNYDKKGVFDGTHIPRANGFNGFPSMIYTSVGDLVPGSADTSGETQSLAWTEDDGVTWQRFEGNPIIPQAPPGMNSGWRDPFVFNSPVLDSVLQLNPSANSSLDRLYITISSGNQTTGPRLLLYTQTTIGNLTSWDYLGPVFSPDINTDFSPWGGNVGSDFEVGNLIWLDEQGDASTAVVTNNNGSGLVQSFVVAGALSRALWFGGDLVANGTGVQMNVSYSGVGDWGVGYACFTFLDDQSAFSPRRLMYCWVREDDPQNEGLLARGWSGALSTPREIFLKVIRNVTSDPSLISEKGSWGHITEADGSTTIYTLGQVRAREVKDAIRNQSIAHPIENAPTGDSTGDVNPLFIPFANQPTSRHYEIYAPITFDTNATAARAGFYLLASPNINQDNNDTSLIEYTTVTYDLEAETITVNRSTSSLVENLTGPGDVGKLRLWNINGVREPLHLVINVDNSIVEVYANDQLAISSRIYPWLNGSVNAGWYLPDGMNSNVSFGETQVWEGFYNAWPNRPDNTSVPVQ